GGLPRDEALRLARVTVGNEGVLRDASRDSRPGEWIRQVWRDSGFAGRTMRRNPGTTASAVLMIALGIGTTTAIFSLVDAVLLRPLPFPEPGRLVRILQRSPRARPTQVTLGDLQDWVAQNRSFAAIGGVAAPIPQSIGVGLDGAAEVINAQNVTAGFFDVLRITPLAGRTFATEDVEASRF